MSEEIEYPDNDTMNSIINQVKNEMASTMGPLVKEICEQFILRKSFREYRPSFTIAWGKIYIEMPEMPEKITEAYIIEETEIDGNVALVFRKPTFEEMRNKILDVYLGKIWHEYYEK